MREIRIVEIEDSFLNLFTPAVIVVAGYFLFNLVGWPSRLIRPFFNDIGFVYDSFMLSTTLSIINVLTVALIFYIIFLPKLRVKRAPYKDPNSNSLFLTLVIACIAFTVMELFTDFIDSLFRGLNSLFIEWNIDLNFYVEEEYIPTPEDLFMLKDPINGFLYVFYIMFAYLFFIEILYRRSIIPLLEDRGIKSFDAVILASIGYALIFIPNSMVPKLYEYLLPNQIYYMIHGILCGLLYIKTRNIIFPIILNAYLSLPELLSTFGYAYENDFLINMPELFSIFSYLITGLVILFILWSIIMKLPSETKDIIIKRSPPEMYKGIFGYLGISFSLMMLLIIVIEFIKDKIDPPKFHNLNFDELFPSVFVRIMFYGAIFSLQFFMTVTTEYARDNTE